MGEFDLISHDGLRLSGFDWPSYQDPHSPRAVIILLHGLAEYSGRYDHVAHYYNKNNIAVVSMDLRGHGLSEGRHVFIPTVESMFRDIDLLIDETRHRYPFCPAILYGHSMGGNLALSYTLNRYPNALDNCPYQAIIVTGPWIRLARSLQPPRPLNSLIRTFCRLSPSLKVPLRVDARTITRDENIAYAYNEDPYIRRSATLSLAHTMGNMATMLDRTACTFHIPVLIQHGNADSLTSHNASAKFATRGKNIQFKSWPDCYHELHNEPEREEIFDFTLNWICGTILS
jgi:alpha-beta hydrolase superfamily lysophospholipase